MNLNAKTELLKRLSSAPHVAGLKSVVETTFALASMIGSAKKRAADDPNLSQAGRATYVAKIAQDNLRPLAEANAAARKMSRFNSDRRASLKPPVPPRDDTTGEMKRAELRAFVRGLPLKDRLAFASRHREAILDAAPELSGLPQGRYDTIREDYVKSNFGAEISEIEILGEDLAVVKAAYDLALNELRANAGISSQEFSKLVDNTTLEIDGV